MIARPDAGARRRVLASSVLVLLTFGAAACGTPSSPGSASGATSATGGPATKTVPPGTVPTGKASPAASSAAGTRAPAGTARSAPTCSRTVAGPPGTVTMTGLVFEAQQSTDRTSLLFDSAVPGYTVQPNPGGATFASPGGPISLAGSYGLKLLLNGARVPARLQQQADLTPASAVLQEIRFIGVSGTTAEFGIGLSRAACPAISTGGGPPRLLLDFPAA